MVIVSASGTRYLYDMRSNRICLEEEFISLPEAKPIVFDKIEEADTLPNIDTFIIELTQSCNFRCSYCYYGGAYSDNRPHSSKNMDEETLLQSIGFISKHRVADRPLNVALYCGWSSEWPCRRCCMGYRIIPIRPRGIHSLVLYPDNAATNISG